MLGSFSTASAPTPRRTLSWLDAALVDLLPAAVYVCEAPSGFIVRYNRRAAELWGREPAVGVAAERFCGAHRLRKPDGTLVPPALGPVAEALHTGASVSDREVVVERPDGSRVTALVSAEVIRGEGEAVLGAVTVFQDISDRKQAEEQLLGLQKRQAAELADLKRLREMSVRRAPGLELRPILEDVLHTAAAVGGTDMGLMSLCGEGGDCLEVAASIGLGGDPLALIGRVPPDGVACGTCFQRRERVVVEDTESDPIFEPYREAARTAGFRAVHSTPLLTRDGRIIGVLSTHFRHPHRPSDHETHLLDLCARQAVDFIEHARLYRQAQGEITERHRTESALRRSELRFRRLMEKLPAAAYTCDPQGLITYFNEQAAQLWGREPRLNDPADRFCGSFRLYLADGSPITHDRCWMALALRTGGEYTGEEILIDRPDGTRVTALAHAAPIRDESDRLLGAVNILVDITDRKRAEQERERLLAEVREADRRKDEFLAMLAHELRNPLAPVRNALQIMRIPQAPPDVLAQAREMTERQVGIMARLIDDLLEVSRVTRGKIRLEPEPVDLATSIRRAVEAVLPALNSRGHELTLSLPDEPVRLVADPARLEQVFVNLLTNAAKYTPAGGRVRVTAGCDGPSAVVRVGDSGVGIAPELLPRIFDLFVQADQGSERTQGGLGIGLTLVKSLVEMHGGSVEAHSAGLGQGSEFVVRLPRAAGGPAREARPARQPASKPRAPSRRVLVVDDSEDAVDSLAMLLRLHGHEVRTAGSGPAAITAADNFRPDVVFLDIGLPGADGYEVARRIRLRENGPRPLLVAVTGFGEEEAKRRSAEAGFDHHLIKPAAPEQIGAILASLNGH